jgi:C_GCAxxG_C_C family probable redox protein
MTRSDDAIQIFAQGFNCCQAIIATYGPAHGLDRITALRVGGAIGGGMGRTGRTCGAVSGALMTIGLAHAKTTTEGGRPNDKAYELAAEFIRRFQALHNTTDCQDLLGVNIGTAAGMEQARQAGFFRTRCPAFVRSAAQILEELQL